MILVVALLVKSFATVFARVRLVPGVYPSMRVQRRTPVERFSANGARVRLFFGVYDLVAAQRGRLSEAFAANLANERSGACVNWHVSRQVVMSVKNFSAMVACKCLNWRDRSDRLRQFLGAGRRLNGLGRGESPERHLM